MVEEQVETIVQLPARRSYDVVGDSSPTSLVEQAGVAAWMAKVRTARN